MVLVLASGGPRPRRADRAAPVALQDFDVGAHRSGSVCPADGKAAAFDTKTLVAARQHVGETLLPMRRGRWRYDVGAALGGEQFERSDSRLSVRLTIWSE